MPRNKTWDTSVRYFTAAQYNNSDTVNKLDVASRCDTALTSSLLHKIKQGDTALGAVSYEFNDESTQ
ncbi:hypothetical protein GWO62_05820 [Corynebacterium macginleyi]|uniref:hypothetical protein n=1 Tax=Corynebacterium macginleyi TaxID=38290 RepID=UPI00190AF9E1|nr:hypothetical protein [Corynebacterium macginleyi]MBK4137036.1 hypothetical protein [Corynebacterium macginleyi]MBK4152683.1 hypothetical protein [Corynebacterium macginleyi]